MIWPKQYISVKVQTCNEFGEVMKLLLVDCRPRTFSNTFFIEGSWSNKLLLSLQLKEFANFDFDVWRKKYMRWMNHKKSRVMDFFRRIDKDQDGKITRQEFIDGILASSRH